jgi:hypothetical protein
MKKRLVMAITATSIIGVASLACAETVTRIAGSRITVRDARGNEKTIEGSAKGLKVGDKVRLRVKDGRTWLDPQPEPPRPWQTRQGNMKPSAQRQKVHATPEAPPPPPPPPGKPQLK